jgi:hypothetical protein
MYYGTKVPSMQVICDHAQLHTYTKGSMLVGVYTI